MNLSELQRKFEGRGIAPKGVSVAKIILQATVNHRGWEMDNDVWLVELSNGEYHVLGTNHGGLCEVTDDELAGYIESTKDSLDSLLAIKAEI